MVQASPKRAADGPVIPDRLYFKIGDVARICGVETYVLRFWETQFPQLKPHKSGTGQRLYRRRDVELALEIQRLVHKEGYTLAGARHALEAAPSHRKRLQPTQSSADQSSERRRASQSPDAAKAALNKVRAELKEIAAMLDNPQPAIRRDRARIIKVRPESDSLFPL
ncbi:MAG TPA: MerR family transcriptional regulator [Terracidiphilus sp.]|nr:MerR family transcriptional regulator [Terracidiphilus sp.]